MCIYEDILKKKLKEKEKMWKVKWVQKAIPLMVGAKEYARAKTLPSWKQRFP